MSILDNFFGVVPSSKGTPILAAFYAVLGAAFSVLSFTRWIMPHAESDLFIPWGVVSLFLFCTGAYGYWAVTRGDTWHHRQFVSASWGFLLMFACWAIVYIVMEDHQVIKVNGGCMALNPTWTIEKCNSRRKTAVIVATILCTIGLVLGIYFTLVVSKWVGVVEWDEHVEEERHIEETRSGQDLKQFADEKV
ncbi:hypothetical protein BGZ94_006832 [Podila epigama]|nr:hypothetical protein BGZ94_006832 [Podila epigama]